MLLSGKYYLIFLNQHRNKNYLHKKNLKSIFKSLLHGSWSTIISSLQPLSLPHLRCSGKHFQGPNGQDGTACYPVSSHTVDREAWYGCQGPGWHNDRVLTDTTVTSVWPAVTPPAARRGHNCNFSLWTSGLLHLGQHSEEHLTEFISIIGVLEDEHFVMIIVHLKKEACWLSIQR